MLMMGPVCPPYTGQSVAFTMLVNALQKDASCKVSVLTISRTNRILLGLKLCFNIVYCLTVRKYDVVYFTCSRSKLGSVRDLVLLYMAGSRKIRIVNHLHGRDFAPFFHSLPFWYRKLVYWGYSKIDTNIVLYEGMKKDFKQFPRMKCVVVPNAFSSSLDALPLVKEEVLFFRNRILFLSNIIRSKGIMELLHACKRLMSIFENLDLTIAGVPMRDEHSTEIEIKHDFECMVEELSQLYPGRVEYLGPVCGKKKEEVLWRSTIAVLPTYYSMEAFPISVIEAMRAGNYIITTTFGNLPEWLNEENGAIIEPSSVDALISAIGSILNDRDRLIRVCNHNIRHVAEHYSEKIYVDNVRRILTI